MTYTWPSTLRLPSRPPKLVYLDLNHWISLAKAQRGHSDGDRFKDSLAAACDAADRGAAVFPISDAIYSEITQIGQHRQRRDLREVIERVSGFMVVTSRPTIATHEVESLLDERVGPSRDPINTMDYLDWGAARAFGIVGGFAIRSRDSGEDVTNEVRAQHPGGPDEFDRVMRQAQLDLNRSVLDGPSPEEEPAMRRLGWDPMPVIETARRRAEQEIEQVKRFDADPKWRRGRIRDVVVAREVAIELNEALGRGLANRGVDFNAAFPAADDPLRAWGSMPSFDVAVTMKTEYHRDGRHRWTRNDVHDIDALGSTIPYCDVVVTDRAAASHATRMGLSERFGTIVLSRLSDLTQHL